MLNGITSERLVQSLLQALEQYLCLLTNHLNIRFVVQQNLVFHRQTS